MKTAHFGGTKVLMAGKRIGLDLTARWYHALSPTISTRPACSCPCDFSGKVAP